MTWISIDLKTLTTKKAGIGRYTINLSKHLLKHRAFDYFGISGPETDPDLLRTLCLSRLYHFPVRSTIIRSALLPFFLPKYIDLHHGLDNYGILPQGRKIKRITTIHDVLVFLYPQHFNRKHRHVVGHLTRSAVKSSDHILTNSHSTKQEILNVFLKLKPENITVTHLASNFKPAEGVDSNRLYEHFNDLPQHYLLSVGTLEPRKNLKRLILAFSELKEAKKIQDVGLVLVGGRGWLDSGVGADQEELSKQGIFPLGFVADEWLSQLYSNALAFVYPSIHEGFGLPPLEAMSCGAPVILSETSSLPEVGGDAALYVDPFSVDSIQSAIEKIVNDSELRNTLSEKSLLQSRKFSWDETARLTEEVYRTVLGR